MNKLRKLKEEKYRRLTEEKYRYFIPNGKVNEYLQQTDFIRIFSAANGVGKTAVACNIIANLTCSIYNNFFKISFFENFKKPNRGRIVSTGTNISENIVPELKKWLPKGQYTTSKGGKLFESKWKINNSSFDIMTYEQDSAEFESVTLDWVWFDEPPPYKIFAATVARFRFGGVIYITMTPLSDAAWIYDEIVLNEAKQKSVIYANIEENCKEHGIRGILEHSNIEQMIAEYTDDEKEARTTGKFMHLKGLVYKEYNEKVHFIKPFKIGTNYSVYCALDPHPRTPHAVMWLAVDNQGTKYIIDELFTEGAPDELAGKIKAKENEMGIVPRYRIIDPMALVKDQTKNVPILQDQLNSLGLYFHPASKDLTVGILRVKQALHFGMEDCIVTKSPELYIFNNCQRTDWEFKRYTWDEWSPRMREQKTAKLKPKDKDDHMMENLYRLLLLEPKFIPPESDDGEMYMDINTITGYGHGN